VPRFTSWPEVVTQAAAVATASPAKGDAKGAPVLRGQDTLRVGWRTLPPDHDTRFCRYVTKITCYKFNDDKCVIIKTQAFVFIELKYISNS
jgi:hypothetical protein